MPFPPVDKLPLSARKDFRDNFEGKRSEWEAKLSELLGQPWKITATPTVIFPYIDRADLKDRIGVSLGWYIDPFLSNVEGFLRKFGADGRSEINELAPSHTVEIAPQTTTKHKYGGLSFEDGFLRIVFAEGAYVNNVQYVTDEDAIRQAIKTAPRQGGSAGGLNMELKNSIASKYDPKIEEARAAIAKQIALPDVKLDPNFEANAAALAAKHGDGGKWEQQFGMASFNYFEALASTLESRGFGKDDMLQEAFKEEITTGTVQLRIVDALKKKRYNEVAIDGGVLVLQTTAEQWWVNVRDVAEDIMDLF